jgi:hypothetical protein
MSLMLPFLRLIDPNVRMDHEERKKHVQRKRESEPEGGTRHDVTAARPPPAEAFACRVCDYRSTERAYCPRCLADTMHRAR